MPAIFLTSPTQAENARSLIDEFSMTGDFSGGLVIFIGNEGSIELEKVARKLFPNAQAFLCQRDLGDLFDFSRHSTLQMRLCEALLFVSELVPETLGSRLLNIVLRVIGLGNPGPVIIGWPGARLASLLSIVAPKRNGLHIVDDGLESIAFASDRFRYLTRQFYGAPSTILRGSRGIHFYSQFPLLLHEPDSLTNQPVLRTTPTVREENQDIWIIGSPAPKLYGLDPEPYLEWIRAVCREASIESRGVVYLPHRREDSNLVSKIDKLSENLRFSNAENFDIFFRTTAPPVKLTGIVSTVHFTASHVFPESTVIECVVPVSWWKTRPTAFAEVLLQQVIPCERIQFVVR